MEPSDDTPVLRWFALRALLVLLLVDAGRPLTVAELVAGVERAGFSLAGRAGKTVSDALRSEVARGRVIRLGRGTYRAGSVAKSTKHRMRRVVAAMRNQEDVRLSA